MNAILLLIGSALPLISSGVYVASIVRGDTRPQRMTRFLMMAIGALSFAALLAGHDTSGVWLALASFVTAIAMWVASLKRGIGGRERLDLWCLGLCAAGLLLWLLGGQSMFGLIMSIVADFVACVPSLLKTARLPHTENLAAYALDAVAGACVAVAGKRTPAALAYPLYIAAVNALFAGLIWHRRRKAAFPTDTASDRGILEA
ncbi:MAG TPA: hypothetical protein VF466_04580 [Candidatus Saccharimonadales bacterium]